MVSCPLCGGEVDWVTVQSAARLLRVTPGRIRQLLLEGRFPGAVKYHPGAGIAALWKIPVPAVVALIEFRKEDASE